MYVADKNFVPSHASDKLELGHKFNVRYAPIINEESLWQFNCTENAEYLYNLFI